MSHRWGTRVRQRGQGTPVPFYWPGRGLGRAHWTRLHTGLGAHPEDPRTSPSLSGVRDTGYGEACNRLMGRLPGARKPGGLGALRGGLLVGSPRNAKALCQSPLFSAPPKEADTHTQRWEGEGRPISDLSNTHPHPRG